MDILNEIQTLIKKRKDVIKEDIDTFKRSRTDQINQIDQIDQKKMFRKIYIYL